MSDDKYVRAIARLLHETQDGTLKWSVCTPDVDRKEGTDIVVGVVYEAEKDGHRIRLYTYKYQSYYEEFDELYWTEDVALELGDKTGTSWWRFPGMRITKDLLQAVQLRTVDVDTFIDRLLSEGE